MKCFAKRTFDIHLTEIMGGYGTDNWLSCSGKKGVPHYETIKQNVTLMKEINVLIAWSCRSLNTSRTRGASTPMSIFMRTPSV